MVILCQLKDLNLSCFGCCGNTYSNKKKLLNDIKKSSKELKAEKKKLSAELKQAKDEEKMLAPLRFKRQKFNANGVVEITSGITEETCEVACAVTDKVSCVKAKACTMHSILLHAHAQFEMAPFVYSMSIWIFIF